MWSIPHLILLFLVALTVSATATLFIVRKRGTLGQDSPDDHRKQHAAPVSRLGGAAIFLALALGFVLLGFRLPSFTHAWLPIIIANTLMFSIGFLDDLRPLGAKVKLIGQIGCALILFSMGVSIDVISNPFGSGSLQLGWWSLPVTLLWLIAIPNIINLIDGMDGLATGFGMFLCLTLAFIGYYSHRSDVVLVSLVMGGALAGFLIFNFPPAKIFLGDGGAYLIGFFVASVSLMTSNKGSIIASLLVILVALGIPILDTAFAIIRRAIRGMPIFRADAEHIHHRLITLGYSKAQALGAMYTVCLVLSLAGISIMFTRGLAIPIVAALAFLLAVVAARYLGYIRTWRDLRHQVNSTLDRRRQREYVRAHGTLLELEVEHCPDAANFTAILQTSLNRLGLSTASGPGLTPLRLRCVSNAVVTLYRSNDDALREEWQFRGELLEPALSAALDRWQTLPGLQIERPDSPTTANLSPA
jgi:UDP-GlcNAc:undecaprenyl-phosphate GlcNAc-1-phosphate transferase